MSPRIECAVCSSSNQKAKQQHNPGDVPIHKNGLDSAVSDGFGG
ncbi:MAG: hypothetical protein WCL71_07620 [Deltaproteobacteria bacterium]